MRIRKAKLPTWGIDGTTQLPIQPHRLFLKERPKAKAELHEEDYDSNEKCVGNSGLLQLLSCSLLAHNNNNNNNYYYYFACSWEHLLPLKMR
jgi:hypothetical protein